MKRLTFEDRIGHVGYALMALGTLFIAEKIVWGWPIHLVGSVVWIWLGMRLKMSSIFLWEIGWVILSLWGWWRWT